MNPRSRSPEGLVKAIIANVTAPRGSDVYRANAWAHSAIMELSEDRPSEALEAIIQVLKLDATAPVIEYLSAGPLEQLLLKRGETVMPRIEELAPLEPALRRALGGVWKSSIPETVWSRVERLRDLSYWND